MKNNLYLKIAGIPIKMTFSGTKWRNYLKKVLKPLRTNTINYQFSFNIANKKISGCSFISHKNKYKITIICPSSLRYFKHFNDYFKIAFSQLLTYKDGFLLHASSLTKNGKGFLFIGSHGAGKSTLVKLAGSEFLSLNDDYAIVRKVGKDFYVFISPFREKNKIPVLNRSAKIEKIFFINKSVNTFADSIDDKSEIYKKLLSNLLTIQVMKKLKKHYPKSYLKKLFKLTSSLTKTVPFYRLDFTKDNQFIKYLS